MDRIKTRELRKLIDPQGERLLLILQSLVTPESALESATPIKEYPLKLGTVLLTKRNGTLRFASVTARTKDGNGIVLTFFATSYRKKIEVYPGTYWWKEMRVVSDEVLAVAKAAESHFEKVDPAPPAVLTAAEKMAEKAFAESIAKPITQPAEVRHVAALPQSLVVNIAEIKGKSEGISGSLAQLWTDYIEHATRVEEAVKENTAAVKELVAAIRSIPCDNKGRA